MIAFDALTIIVFMALLGVALYIYFLAASSKAAKKNITRVINAIHAPNTVSVQVSESEFDMLDAKIAAGILLASYPHDETEVIAGAPGNLTVQIRKTIPIEKTLNDWFGEFADINLSLYYDVPLPIQGLGFTVRKAMAKLVIKLEELKNPCKVSEDFPEGIRKTLRIKYMWEGASTATSDMFSQDYKILHYLIKRTELEINARGYKRLENPNLVQKKRRRKSRFSQAEKDAHWTRSFEAVGGRTYNFWPTPEAYSEAVQNPQHSFKDEALRNCQVTVNAMGLPCVQSGMFASVYEFKNDDEQWAVRCFTTRLIDQQERYKAISSFILADDLSYTVDFHYLEDGIKYSDAWFPILKMVWVEGQAFDMYIREHLNDVDALKKLKSEFQTMMQQLRRNGVAHGDLQHGNMLISHGDIFLVDYDGFYVPALAGRQSNELGHPNYQHPGRDEKLFGPAMDNFSAWVIYLSLVILIEDPDLWGQLGAGDECLLFKRIDYLKPESSQRIKTLQAHANITVREAVSMLLEFLKMPVEEIPFLETDIFDLEAEMEKTPQVQLAD